MKNTVIEATRIFPEEARLIATEKIKYYEKIKKPYLADIKTFLSKIKKIKNKFSQSFWEEALKVVLPKEYCHAVERLAYWRNMERFMTNKGFKKKIIDSEHDKAIAKTVSIQQLYPFQKLRKVGKRYQALCPLHGEKTSSFVIYPNNTFYCFGCHQGGDSIKFLQLINECSYIEALGQLSGGGYGRSH